MSEISVIPYETKRKEKIDGLNVFDEWSESRYCIVDKETGEILDDVQGYGYKTRQKAYAAWNYKHRDQA